MFIESDVGNVRDIEPLPLAQLYERIFIGQEVGGAVTGVVGTIERHHACSVANWVGKRVQDARTDARVIGVPAVRVPTLFNE